MSETKRTKGSTTRRAAGREAVDVLEKGAEAEVLATDHVVDLDDVLGDLGVPVPVETLDGLDDILGEILPPPAPVEPDDFDDILADIAPAPAAVEDLDDILGELAAAPTDTPPSADYVMGKPAPAPTSDALDDILGELAPAPADVVDSLDDILGEIAPPTAAADSLDDILGEIAPVESLDDILGEIAPPARVETVESLDDILGEIAPASSAQPAESLDDILGELAPLPPVESLDDILGELAPLPPAESLDDILGELAPLPAPIDAGESLDDILGELAPPAPAADPVVETKAKGKKRGEKEVAPVEAPEAMSDDFNAMLDEMAASMPDPVVESASEAEGEGTEEGEDGSKKKPGLVTKLRALAGKAVVAVATPFKGKREISRMTFAGMIASIGVLGTAVVGQATYIIARPSGAVHHAPEPAPARTIVPVDYSKVDMTLYRDKVRSLHEGGRDMLRNPAIKEAVLNLDNGEMLHEELRELARGDAAADRVDIRNDQVTITSCEGMICPAKSFKLVYRLQTEDAVVCMTERTGEGLARSYSFGPDGYHEWPSCDAIH
ncbi:hypothetical protein WG901_05675 [Novosphingobium sp. PS1R-30]|uniref:Uncharacterized protein n=1 Tax=Novosphingobium anseongense TaxID=3133436 RepID=A0ABU8RST1_9SPHN